MSVGARLFILITGVILFIIVFELVRKKRFREELSIIWLFFATIVAFGSVVDIVVDPLAKFLRIHYPPTLVFVLITIFLIVSLLYFSLVTSDLKTKVKELTQKTALLEFEISQKMDKG